MQHRILLVDDDPLSLLALESFLTSKQYLVDSVRTSKEAFEKLQVQNPPYSLIILDYRLDGEAGDGVAQKILSQYPECYILIYSGDQTREAVRSSWEAGAVGFLEKGDTLDALLSTVQNWCRKYEETYQSVNLKSALNDSTALISSIGLVGKSKSMAVIAEKVSRYRGRQENVLILGETGTGKEKIAAALHPGSKETFFAINCAVYAGNSDLLESDLFGHVKGAFTGATRDHIGVLEAASGGTVFLDEVHTLEIKAQQKLLRALQEKKIRSVGTTKEISVNFRLIAAAKPEITKSIGNGKFLADLYERLNVLHLVIPPLRERIEDIEPLVAYFCENFERETKEKKRVLNRTLKYLEKYSWPRNVRELENLIRRLCVDVPGECIEPKHLDAVFFQTESPLNHAPGLKSQVDELLKQQVQEALVLSSSQREAARKLGLPESTLRRMLKRFDLRNPA